MRYWRIIGVFLLWILVHFAEIVSDVFLYLFEMMHRPLVKFDKKLKKQMKRDYGVVKRKWEKRLNKFESKSN